MFSASKSSAPASGGYTLSKSLRFRSSASAYLSRTPASATNQKTWTFSAWLKRGTISTSEITLFGKADTYISVNSNQLNANFNSGSTNYFITSSAVLVDPSAWYHVVLVLDTTQATAANRASMYVNGVKITSFATSTYTNMAQNYNAAINTAAAHAIGRYSGATPGAYLDGYLAEVNFIDGQALTPSSFGATSATTGQWSPATYSGSYGTNGFHLTFTNTTSTTTLGYDTSGNSNNWTTNNISLTAGSTYDSMNDVPVAYSATAANYATWNPLTVDKPNLTNGNLDADGSDLTTAISTIGVSSGKWYWEITIGSGTNTPNMGITSYANDNANPGVYNGVGRSFVSAGGGSGVYKAYTATSTTANTAFSNANTAGATIGFALDCNAGTIAYYVNNTLGYTDSTVATGTLLYPMTCNFNSTLNNYRITSLNTGQRAFAYTPPSGYNALNTYNLPTPTIAQGNKYMDATLYTGNGTSQTITNAGLFQPDFVWAKGRSGATSNILVNAVTGANQFLLTDATQAEATSSALVSAFTSSGFSIGSSTSINNSSSTYVGWQWKANGSGSSNTAGSITSTVSANTTSGFSVVTYTGSGSNATVGHGLGVAPSMIIGKARNNTNAWRVYHTSIGAANFLVINATDASASGATWNSTTPTSTVFTVGGGSNMNVDSSTTYVAYCFAQIAGFSAFGSYTGNGGTTGPFIYTGFQPKYLLVKRTDSTSDWYIWDSVRNTFNIITNTLLADTAGAETSANSVNILANGFLCASTTVVNVSTGTYIYAAFASNPFKYANAF